MNNKLLSLFITPMTGNGGDRVVINLAKAFVELGFRVDLVTAEVTEYHQQILQTLPPEIRTIEFGLPVSKTIYLKKLFKLKHYLNQEKPLVLLANGDYVGISNFAKLLSNSHTKIIQVIHVHVSQYFGDDRGLKAKLKPLFLKEFYSRSDGIIAVSKGVAENLANLTQIPLEKVQVIYNPVVTPDLLQAAREPVNHTWFNSGEPPVILGAGRLMAQKDFATLIRAFAIVCQHRECRLVIIGGDPILKNELEALIQELQLKSSAQLAGFAHNPYAYMSKAALFVLSSRYEGFGNVLVEAMATGTPVVSTNCESGPAEILENGRYGRLTPVGDPQALAEAILATLDAPIDAQVLQNRAQEFTDIAIAKQYINFINSLAC